MGWLQHRYACGQSVSAFARRTIATVWTLAESGAPPFHRAGLPDQSCLFTVTWRVLGRGLLCLPEVS